MNIVEYHFSLEYKYMKLVEWKDSANEARMVGAETCGVTENGEDDNEVGYTMSYVIDVNCILIIRKSKKANDFFFFRTTIKSFLVKRKDDTIADIEKREWH